MNRKDKKVFSHIKGAVKKLEKKSIYSQESFGEYIKNSNISVSNMSSVVQELVDRGYLIRLGDDNLMRTEKP